MVHCCSFYPHHTTSNMICESKGGKVSILFFPFVRHIQCLPVDFLLLQTLVSHCSLHSTKQTPNRNSTFPHFPSQSPRFTCPYDVPTDLYVPITKRFCCCPGHSLGGAISITAMQRVHAQASPNSPAPFQGAVLSGPYLIPDPVGMVFYIVLYLYCILFYSIRFYCILLYSILFCLVWFGEMLLVLTKNKNKYHRYFRLAV